MKKILLKAKDGYKLNLHIFETENTGSVKGYIQIIHGMEEHQERYEDFIHFLNKAGYTVVSSDMRGHGKSAPELGFFKERDGYKYLLSDQKRITSYIKKRFITDKVIIFAHSMGTIIARNLMQSQSWNYKAVILSGYPCSPGMAALGFGILLTKSISMVKGARYYSKFVQNISTGSFNKSMEEQETGLEWLSTNKDNIKKYIDDPYCGHGFKVLAFNDLFHLTKNMAQAWRYKSVNKKLPILALRGEKDAATGFDKGSRRSIKTLEKAGFENISQINYKSMRHEILNEKDKDVVYKDVLQYLGQFEEKGWK